jgi:hypothetical protein
MRSALASPIGLFPGDTEGYSPYSRRCRTDFIARKPDEPTTSTNSSLIPPGFFNLALVRSTLVGAQQRGNRISERSRGASTELALSSTPKTLRHRLVPGPDSLAFARLFQVVVTEPLSLLVLVPFTRETHNNKLLEVHVVPITSVTARV